MTKTTVTPIVLHICLSPGWGGLEMYPIRVGKEFLEQGNKVYGLCIAGSQVAKGMREAGVETFEVSSKQALILSQIPKLNKWLKQRNVNIVHCHKSGDILVSALLSLLTKRTTFFTEHMGVTRPKTDLYHKWAYSHIDQVFSISDETYQRNLKALPVPAEKITRFWLGTDIPVTPIESADEILAIKQDLGLNPESKIIGNVGRLCSGKGQMELLEAFALISDSHPNSELLLVGGLDVADGSDNNFVGQIKARIAELSLTHRVHLAGFRQDTNRMLAVMDVVCLPNHNEAFGLTAIEAMAAKKAIVGANTGALPEILEPVALLCNPLAPSEIAAQIVAYLDNVGLQKKNEDLAYLRAKTEFSMPAHIDKLRQFYLGKLSHCGNAGIQFKHSLRNKLRVSKGNSVDIADTAKLRQCAISIKGTNNRLTIEDGANIRGTQIEIDGVGCHIHIKKNCIIGHDCYLSAREDNITLELGEDCMLSRNVKIMTSDGHNIIKNGQRINHAKSIEIGKHVWLADNATILKGANIGDHSILGINSTLTKSVEANCIAVGNPAKVVQSDVTWQHELTY